MATTFGWAWVAACESGGHSAAFHSRQLFAVAPWLLGLALGILLLAALAPAAFAGSSWMRPLAYALAGLHVGNGLLHLVASLVARRPVPGVISAPALLLAGGWLAWTAARLG